MIIKDSLQSISHGLVFELKCKINFFEKLEMHNQFFSKNILFHRSNNSNYGCTQNFTCNRNNRC